MSTTGVGLAGPLANSVSTLAVEELSKDGSGTLVDPKNTGTSWTINLLHL